MSSLALLVLDIHEFILQVEQYEGHLIMNPGSATGAYSNLVDEVVPSFALMDLIGSKVGALFC